MIELMNIYYGLGRPSHTCSVDEIFYRYWMPKTVAMSQEEHDYLSALQLMHGVGINVILFQDFHDEAWENRKDVPLSKVMSDVACSHPSLTDLMTNPQGDLKWKWELENRKVFDSHPQSTFNYKGFF